MDIIKKSYLFHSLATDFKSLTKISQTISDDIVVKFYLNLLKIGIFKSSQDKDKDVDDVKTWLENNRTVLSNFIFHDWQPSEKGLPAPLHLTSYNDYGSGKLSAITEDVRTFDKNYIDINDFKTISVGILHGVGNIPRMSLITYSIYDKETSIEKLVPKELGSEKYLMVALQVFHYTLEPEMVKKFVDDNKAKLNSIKNFFSKSPVYIGGGSDGVAFDIGNERILKIFSDQYSFQKAKESEKLLHTGEGLAGTEAMMYDVGEFKGYEENHPLYYYIMEKMTPVENLENIYLNVKDVLAEAVALISRNPSRKELNELFKQGELLKAKQLIDIAVSKISEIVKLRKKEDIKKVESGHNMKKDWLNKIIKEIIFKDATGRRDLHMGNIGITSQGELRYFDPSYSLHGDAEEDEDIDNLPEINFN